MNTGKNVAYALLFQVGWLVCISQGNTAAILYALIFFMLHFMFLYKHQPQHNKIHELYWLAIVSIGGFLMEILFFSAKLIYMDGTLLSFSEIIVPPLWLFALWGCFSIALRTCFTFIFKLGWWGYLLIALMAPLSYLAGSHLNNNIHINQPIPLSLILIGISWTLFLWCTRQLNYYFSERT